MAPVLLSDAFFRARRFSPPSQQAKANVWRFAALLHYRSHSNRNDATCRIASAGPFMRVWIGCRSAKRTCRFATCSPSRMAAVGQAPRPGREDVRDNRERPDGRGAGREVPTAFTWVRSRCRLPLSAAGLPPHSWWEPPAIRWRKHWSHKPPTRITFSWARSLKPPPSSNTVPRRTR